MTAAADGSTLITGISGFLAGNLARALAADGVTIIGAGRSVPVLPEVRDAARFVPLDLRDYAATLASIEREQPQTVYHLAASSVLQAVVTDGPRAMLETNVAGTWNLLEACRQVGVPALVVASSDKQYGALAPPPYDDEDSTAFQNGGVYELSKAQQDQVARLYAGLYETPAVRVARLVNIYGPGDIQWTRIVPGNIRRTYRGERPRITAGPAGAALREYLFVEDAVAALRGLARDAHTRGNEPLRRPDGKLARVAVNIASEHRHAAGDVIATIQRVMREDFGVVGPEPEELPGTPGVFEPGSQYTEGAKLRALLPDYTARDLATGLRATIPWYLDYLRSQAGATVT
jgi:CDP-glucose 4,6-dehydratase